MLNEWQYVNSSLISGRLGVSKNFNGTPGRYAQIRYSPGQTGRNGNSRRK